MKSAILNSLQIHSINNTDTIGYFLSPNIDGLDFPDLRVNSFDKAGEDGAVVASVFYSNRLITFRGVVFGRDSITYQARRRALIAACRKELDVNNKPVTKKLYIVTDDDLNLQVDVIVKDFKMKLAGTNKSDFLIQLEAPDYRLLAQTLTSNSIAVYGGGGAIYPVIYPVVYDAGTGGTVGINNSGTANATVKLYINGYLSSPRLTNLTTGKFIEIQNVIASSEQYIVDMSKKTIIQGGITNRISYKSSDSDWWELVPGTNLLQLTTDETSDDGNILVEYRNSYLGV